jgi:hypothetical protein
MWEVLDIIFLFYIPIILKILIQKYLQFTSLLFLSLLYNLPTAIHNFETRGSGNKTACRVVFSMKTLLVLCVGMQQTQ